MTVVPIATQKTEMMANAREQLLELIAQIDAGRIAGVAFAAVQQDGCAVTNWSDNLNFSGLIGAVAILQHQMLEKRPREIGE